MITIVSGLPRSGTSMMMQMLANGGMTALTDNVRKSDEDNPHGYFEFERAKQIKNDTAWLPDAEAKVVKMVAMLLYSLPSDREYRIVFMKRDLGEMLKSQTKMLEHLGKAGKGPTDEEMRKLYEAHLAKITAWLANQKNMKVLYCDYTDVLTNSSAVAERVQGFLGIDLDVGKMAKAVDSTLYRNRK